MKTQNAKNVGQKVASFYDFFRVLTFADKILILILLIFSVGSIFLTSAFVSHPSYILIEVNGDLIGQFRLSENREIPVAGKTGETFILIENNDARVIDSPCPHKLCMQKRLGDLIVCIPNGVVIKFKNDKDKNQFDTISR